MNDAFDKKLAEQLRQHFQSIKLSQDEEESLERTLLSARSEKSQPTASLARSAISFARRVHSSGLGYLLVAAATLLLSLHLPKSDLLSATSPERSLVSASTPRVPKATLVRLSDGNTHEIYILSNGREIPEELEINGTRFRANQSLLNGGARYQNASFEWR